MECKKEKREEFRAHATKRFTDIYIANFGDELDNKKLKKLFQKFGKINNHKVITKNHGKSKGYGFVSFEDPESAKNAIEAMNGKEINTKILYVCRARDRAEQRAQDKLKLEKQKMNCNLCVENLDETIDGERLYKEFSPFGNIISANVEVKKRKSKGFGFVQFSSPEEATKAIVEMNGRMIGSKQLQVGLAQPK